MELSREERRVAALDEVRQHRPAGEQEVLTIEFQHPAFPADQIPRVVRDNADLVARLETDEVVTFIAAAFEATGPASGENQWPKIELSVEGVAVELEPHLDLALTTADPIIVIVRSFLRSAAMDGPAQVLRNLELDRTTAGDLRVTGTAGFFGFNKRFGKFYDPRTFPGLG